MRTTKLPPTPLQKVVGFKLAEEIYDELPFSAQIIIDLRIEGMVLQDIAADVFEMPYTTVADMFYRARHFAAMQKFKQTLENRQHYRESHPSVADDPGRDGSANADPRVKVRNNV